MDIELLYTKSGLICTHSLSVKRNESYSLRQLDDPVYDDATPTQPNYSSLGPAYNMEASNDHELTTYDCIENTINTPQAKPANPTPEEDGTSNKDDFYDAEEHTYAAVSKRKLRRKQ